ncbi:OHCU decarboxylase-domain-containing protein [Neurospora tetraspora]|uniref:OHCU decarboxylase-domain-containing protein n=1 Tax=Neurospora tetraspora TaxID=94610 RepID=A0AAE0MNT5_9PEZI|nr:OHCU decarboxylase-domain-containing protein [Neurospora tetraspora]
MSSNANTAREAQRPPRVSQLLQAWLQVKHLAVATAICWGLSGRTPSPELHALALPTLRTISFSSYPDLISTIRDELLAIANAVAVSAADPSVPETEKENIKRPLHAILGSHPRLGEPKKETLFAQSKKEQAHLNAAGDSKEVKEELRKLNKQYEEVFPGLRYGVWVNGRPRREIMAYEEED